MINAFGSASRRNGSFRRHPRSSLSLITLLCCTFASSHAPAHSQEQPSAKWMEALARTTPRSWIVDVAANEVRAIQHRDPYLRYRVHTVDKKGDRVRDIVETRDGTIARLLLKDGKPLTGEEDGAERERLSDMLASPSAFEKHIHTDVTGKKLAAEMVQLMPDAMNYTYTPGQPQTRSAHPGIQVVIDYTPNPNWSPPNTTAQALTGLRGRMWIDSSNRHLLRMDGEIFQSVNFGWGMLAHIYPGGQLRLEQTNVSPERWIYTRFEEHIRIKALMVKTINEDATIEASAFQVLPRALSWQEGIQQLLAGPSPAK